jgi:hypothetical protein
VSGNEVGGRDSFGAGIYNLGAMTITNSTVSGNTVRYVGGGISNGGTMTITNSTVSGNSAGYGGGISNGGTMTITNSTVSGNSAGYGGGISNSGTLTLTNTLVDNDCAGITASGGGNIESPGDTCGFDQSTDQVNVTTEQLALGPLQDNGGPTETHALLPGSIAIDKIPEVDCVDADAAPLTTDQRGQPRPEIGGTMCDVGAFEWSAGDAALASYCAAVLECFPDDASCEADFLYFLWVGFGGDLTACTSAKLELVECVASLDCDQLGRAREDFWDVVWEECLDQLEILYSACEIPVK